jgi:dihydroorotate dehydrogenase
MFGLTTRALHLLPPEAAHGCALTALRLGLVGPSPAVTDPRLRLTVAGVGFDHPFGLAAGFDKNAAALYGLLRLGFSHVEAGTVTPRPQAGNPKPRLFRLAEDGAIINRMGFNNQGLDVFCARLQKRPHGGVVGANIGCNKDSADRTADFVTGLERVYPLADYVTVNVSSPNTPGLRNMQAEAEFDTLLARLAAVRHRLHDEGVPSKPLLVKIAPDMAEAAECSLVDTAVRHGVSGLIVSNTTLTRPDSLRSTHKTEAGGLSGTPLFEASTEQLRRLYRHAGGALVLVGVGGVRTGADAYAKIRAGAALVQGYTGFIYDGAGYAAAITQGLLDALARDKLPHIRHAIGADI